jgi:TonB family protein
LSPNSIGGNLFASLIDTPIGELTMLELKLKTANGNLPSQAMESRQQPRKQALALALLLVTFAALIAKDHDFWFGDTDSSDSDVVSADATPVNPTPAVPVARRSITAPIAATKKQTKIQTTTAQAATAQIATHYDAQPADSGAVATDRAALPPLDVEVVAGDKHSKLHPGNNSTKLQISSTAAPATNAAERVPMSTSISAASASASGSSISGTVTADSYPLLTQQMKVQGSVVLQAIIGVDGNIQDLRVLAGPAILTSAAQQAVRQWRFKPYLQNGQPVETKARITVNFTINVADNTPKIS